MFYIATLTEHTFSSITVVLVLKEYIQTRIHEHKHLYILVNTQDRIKIIRYLKYKN